MNIQGFISVRVFSRHSIFDFQKSRIRIAYLKMVSAKLQIAVLTKRISYFLSLTESLTDKLLSIVIACGGLHQSIDGAILDYT